MIPDHELQPLIVAADDAFAEGTDTSQLATGMLMSAFLDLGKATRVVEVLDAAIAKHPKDTDLLMAKASALCRMMQMKSGEDVIDQVLAIDPEHVDAKMRKLLWEKWPLLFEFPAWSGKSTSQEILYRTQLGRVGRQETKLLLARMGLRLEPIAVQSTDGLNFEHGVRPEMRGLIQVKLVETPYGPIAPWYVLLEDDPANPFVREAFLTASGGTPSPLNGFWLVQRLVACGGGHLVFVSPSQVLYNQRVELLPDQREAVRKALLPLLQYPAPMYMNQIQRAAAWYADNSDFSEIRFPDTVHRTVAPVLIQPIMPEEPGVVPPAPKVERLAPKAERPASTQRKPSGCLGGLLAVLLPWL
jgi:hypothetical protein